LILLYSKFSKLLNYNLLPLKMNSTLFIDATPQEIDLTMQHAWDAFHIYRKLNHKRRSDFMRAIANELENCAEDIIPIAMREARTTFQLRSYAEACERGDWIEIRIDTAIPDKKPPKPDLRKMQIPLGPVVVFGASNFPFAYSTAGGDTACAFAAGCPVIVKAHPAHAETSEKVAAAILTAAKKCELPDGVFAHLHGTGFEVGKQLVMHPHTRAVGFTGSFAGGKQLFDWANQRKVPIPVFSEMGSINPVFLLPEKLQTSHHHIAQQYAHSITQGVGQFCTNPGLIIGIESDSLNAFIKDLADLIRKTSPAPMLHSGIAKAFKLNKQTALQQREVTLLAESEIAAHEHDGIPTLASTTGQAFLNNPALHQEVFGPYSIIVRCKDIDEMIQIALHLEGQLTSTLMATEHDILQHEVLVEAVKDICGRFILNSVPTGVEVCLSMHHGGPFPATTDSRFTAVGADGFKRFTRPVAFQNWIHDLLPPELKNENPLGLWRTVNNELTREQINV
jgi:2,5-dioxopentanoate dehydrogenase